MRIKIKKATAKDFLRFLGKDDPRREKFQGRETIYAVYEAGVMRPTSIENFLMVTFKKERVQKFLDKHQVQVVDCNCPGEFIHPAPQKAKAEKQLSGKIKYAPENYMGSLPKSLADRDIRKMRGQAIFYPGSGMGAENIPTQREIQKEKKLAAYQAAHSAAEILE